MPSPTFDPSALPDMTGKVVFITSGYSGLYGPPPFAFPIASNVSNLLRGLATTSELAKHSATVYIAGRSQEKAEAAITSLKQEQPDAKIEFLQMDLLDLSSVKKGAEGVLARESQPHILIINAGVSISRHLSHPWTRLTHSRVMCAFYASKDVWRWFHLE